VRIKTMIRVVIWLALAAVAAGSDARWTTKNWIRMNKIKSLPDLFFGTLKVDFGKKYRMEGTDTGFGLKLEVNDYDKLFSLKNIKEAGFAVTQKLNYIPPARWNHHPFEHMVRTVFDHNFQHDVTTAQCKLAVHGGSAKISANSKGEFSFCEVGFNWGWNHRKHNIFGVKHTVFELRAVAGKVMDRLDKRRVIAGKHNFWGPETSLQTFFKIDTRHGRERRPGIIEVITSQPVKAPYEYPLVEVRTKHEVDPGRHVASRWQLDPGEIWPINTKSNSYTYGQVEYWDERVDNGWQGEWRVRYKQPLSKPWFPSLDIKRKWKFSDGFFTQFKPTAAKGAKKEWYPLGVRRSDPANTPGPQSSDLGDRSPVPRRTNPFSVVPGWEKAEGSESATTATPVRPPPPTGLSAIAARLRGAPPPEAPTTEFDMQEQFSPGSKRPVIFPGSARKPVIKGPLLVHLSAKDYALVSGLKFTEKAIWAKPLAGQWYIETFRGILDGATLGAFEFSRLTAGHAYHWGFIARAKRPALLPFGKKGDPYVYVVAQDNRVNDESFFLNESKKDIDFNSRLSIHVAHSIKEAADLVGYPVLEKPGFVKFPREGYGKNPRLNLDKAWRSTKKPRSYQEIEDLILACPGAKRRFALDRNNCQHFASHLYHDAGKLAWGDRGRRVRINRKKGSKCCI